MGLGVWSAQHTGASPRALLLHLSAAKLVSDKCLTSCSVSPTGLRPPSASGHPPTGRSLLDICKPGAHLRAARDVSACLKGEQSLFLCSSELLLT